MPSPRASAVLSKVATAISTGDAATAWQHMEQLAPELEQDAEVAAAWLGLLRSTPERPTLVDDVRRALTAHPFDPTLVTRGCDALIRAAERRAPDEPQLGEGPALVAAQLAERCLSGQDLTATSPEMLGYLHVAAGNARRLRREHEPALEHLKKAVELCPQRGGFWFNLGLLHKTKLELAEALDAFERAHSLVGAEKPVLWNLAICATGTGQGERAVRALRALGHDAKLSDTGMPYVDGLPPVQVRVATVGSGHATSEQVPDRSVTFELLWVTPLSPCHGVVSSAAFRVASVDYGDVVLWDAVPIGIAEIEGRPVPRFPILAVLQAGGEHRFRYVALQQKAGDIQAFGEQLPAGTRLFVHAERIEHLCARCASGEHMQKHKHEKPEAHHVVYGKIVVEPGVDLKALRGELDGMLKRSPTVQLVLPGLLEAIGDTVAAGKAHQLWRGLEKHS
jgi:tetratricopeptide (TPR) repeat protein